jgi:tryptophanyl-tRNA synthetase
MAKPILVSGIQPTGQLHIGNYLGALKNFVDLQDSGKYNCFFFIADLHALTENPDPKDLSKNIINLATDFLAAGLDPKKSVIFQQSQIPAHSELAWILNTLTPIGELRRMTQFKEKSEDEKENSNTGLLVYPTLMAADIILYDAKFVPVGDDQLQHLELTRTLVRKFNSKFGKTFVEPQPLLTSTPRVMSLDNPQKKMSKSMPSGCLFLDESPKEIEKKIKSAVTDSGNEIKSKPEKPALTNLIGIYSAFSGLSTKEIEKKFAGKTYSEFKSSLAELITNSLADFRKKKKKLEHSNTELRTIINSGSAKAAKVANKKIVEVKKKIGLTL